MKKTEYEKWIWIELIGFDNTCDNSGVAEFIDKTGFIPDTIILMLFNADFIHLHDSRNISSPFQEDFCSYYGHDRNEERKRQAWNGLQLKRLIDELHKYKIKAYLSVFDLFKTKKWIGEHKELLHVKKDGSIIDSLCPWKRLSNGMLYEDFFIRQLSEVIDSYGFDGFHGADGYAHPRIPIYDGDFSDDMVTQFTNFSGITIPDNISTVSDNDNIKIANRSSWILENAWKEWMNFYSERISSFWEKTHKMLSGKSVELALNSAWTRDPFEAKYRYGVDYKRLAETGINTIIVEAPATVLELESWNTFPSKSIYDFMAMILSLKAAVPELRLLYLNCLKDIEEEYNALRHCPTMLENEIVSFCNLFYRNKNSYTRCFSGVVACLGDSIKQHEWQWLSAKWDLGFTSVPEKLNGTHFVWTKNAMANFINGFLPARKISVHRLIAKLLFHNSGAIAGADISGLKYLQGPLLVPYPEFFASEEISQISAYKNGPVIFISGNALENSNLPEHLNLHQNELGNGYYIFAATIPENKISPAETAGFSPQFTVNADPESWVFDLLMNETDESAWPGIADFLKKSGNGFNVFGCGSNIYVKNKSIPLKSESFTDKNGDSLLVIRNDNAFYEKAEVTALNEIRNLKVLSEFPCKELKMLDKTLFRVKIPNRGVTMLLVQFK